MAVKPLFNENELLAKVAAGDERAFRLIYDQYRKRVYTFSLRMLKSEELAEEVMQESFLKIWQMRSGLPEINNFEVYIRTLTRNKSLNVLRRIDLEAKAGRDRSTTWQEAHNETEEAILLNDSKQVLHAGIDLLPPQQKLAYQLCHQEGLKYEQAAKRMGLSPLTVKTHMQLALKFLRTYMIKHTDVAAFIIILKLLR